MKWFDYTLIGISLVISVVAISFHIAQFTIDNTSIILVFVGILATFVVISNYAQVMSVKNEFTAQVKENKNDIDGLYKKNEKQMFKFLSYININLADTFSRKDMWEPRMVIKHLILAIDAAKKSEDKEAINNVLREISSYHSTNLFKNKDISLSLFNNFIDNLQSISNNDYLVDKIKEQFESDSEEKSTGRYYSPLEIEHLNPN